MYGINYLENKENNEILKNKIQKIYDNIQRIKEEINNQEIQNQINSENEKKITLITIIIKYLKMKILI